MANTRLIQRSFNGGELSPTMFGRMDTTVYQNGLGLMQNFIARPQGPAAKRPGFKYVTGTKGQAVGDYARVIPFTYSTTQTIVIEMGATLTYSGTSVGGVTSFGTVITVSGTPWTTNTLIGQTVWCNGSVATIASNTTSTITMASSWSPSQPVLADGATGLSFQIYSGYLRFHTNGLTLYTGAYVQSWSTITSMTTTWSAGGTVFTCTGHGFKNGDPVVITGSAITGGSVAVNTTYYVVNSGTNVFGLATAAGGSALTIGTAGAGTYLTSKFFYVGDIVTYGGYTWYCTGAHSAPTTPTLTATNYWYRMSATGASGSIFEIPSPYAGPDIMDVHFAQSEDIVVLAHQNYYPRELRRYSATDWTLSVAVFPLGVASGLTPTATAIAGARSKAVARTNQYDFLVTEGNGTAGRSILVGDVLYIRGTNDATLDNQWFYVKAVDLPNYPNNLVLNYFSNGNTWTTASDLTFPTTATIERLDYSQTAFTNKYVVTAEYADGTESSGAVTSPVSLDNALYANGNTNRLTWSVVSGATRYHIYRLSSGLYGRIATTPDGNTTTFYDDNKPPDLGLTPPIYDSPSPLSTPGYYPSTIGLFEQRRFFGGSVQEPQTLYATRVNTTTDMSYRFPQMPEDRLKFKVRSREVNTIRHIVPLNELIILTNSAEWRVSAVNSDILTSDSISVRPQSYVGASNVQPEIVNNSMVFCSARGGHVRELGYNWQSQGFVTSDLSLRAAHLFDHESILDMCMSRAPHPIVWFTSSSGKLLGLTYVPEEQIASWHQHTSGNAAFKSCCAVAEGSEDILYVVTERTVGTTFSRFIERLDEQEQPTAIADSYFVDCGYTKTGASSTTVTGLNWLNGATVQVLADGKVHRSLVVSGGTITLDYAAAKVQVGIGYTGDIETLPVAMQVEGLGQGRTKNVNKAWIRLVESTGVLIGPDADHLVRSNNYDSEPETVRTTEVEVVLNPAWSRDGRIYLRSANPLPTVITSMTIEASIGS